MLAEIRQLRQGLQTSAIAARRAQILIYRLHEQEAAVAHASQRLDEAKSSAEQLRARRKYQEIQIKQYETMKDRAENAAQRQQFEDAIFGAQGTDGSIGGRGTRGAYETNGARTAVQNRAGKTRSATG
jgi:hypothetical protein